MKETKKITTKDLQDASNAIFTLVEFKDKLEWQIEYSQKKINEATQLVEEIKTQIKTVEDVSKNDEILAKEQKVKFLLKDYKKDKKFLEKIISREKENFEFYKSLYNKIIKIINIV